MISLAHVAAFCTLHGSPLCLSRPPSPPPPRTRYHRPRLALPHRPSFFFRAVLCALHPIDVPEKSLLCTPCRQARRPPRPLGPGCPLRASQAAVPAGALAGPGPPRAILLLRAFLAGPSPSRTTLLPRTWIATAPLPPVCTAASALFAGAARTAGPLGSARSPAAQELPTRSGVPCGAGPTPWARVLFRGRLSRSGHCATCPDPTSNFPFTCRRTARRDARC